MSVSQIQTVALLCLFHTILIKQINLVLNKVTALHLHPLPNHLVSSADEVQVMTV